MKWEEMEILYDGKEVAFALINEKESFALGCNKEEVVLFKKIIYRETYPVAEAPELVKKMQQEDLLVLQEVEEKVRALMEAGAKPEDCKSYRFSQHYAVRLTLKRDGQEVAKLFAEYNDEYQFIGGNSYRCLDTAGYAKFADGTKYQMRSAGYELARFIKGF